MSSAFLKLNLTDYERGLLVAVLTALLTPVLQTLEAGSLTFDWKVILTAGLAAGIGYLLKNLATDSKGVFLGSADKK